MPLPTQRNKSLPFLTPFCAFVSHFYVHQMSFGNEDLLSEAFCTPPYLISFKEQPSGTCTWNQIMTCNLTGFQICISTGKRSKCTSNFITSDFSQRFEAQVSEGSQQVTVSGVRPGASYQLVVVKNGSVLLDETVELGEKASQAASSSLNQCSSSSDRNNHNQTFPAKLSRLFQFMPKFVNSYFCSASVLVAVFPDCFGGCRRVELHGRG